MKKVLIHENTDEIQGDIDHVQIVCFPAIEEIIKQFEGLNLGMMTTDLLKDALFNNSTEIYTMFAMQAAEDAKEIKNPVLKQNLFNGIQQAIIDFRLTINGLVGMCNRHLLTLVSINENKPVLTDENLEKLKERHRTYATPKEAELFELHKKIASDLSKLFENTDSSLYGTTYMSRFFMVEDGKFVANPGTNYSALLKQKAVSE